MKTIVAVDNNWGIGKDNGLLFSIPDDMKHFREITTGKVMVMGLNTLRSFPGGRPLKNRLANIVLSNVDIPAQDGLTVCRSLSELKAELSKFNTDDIYIIGGGMMYRTFCDFCAEAYITKVKADGNATAFFPNLDSKPNWCCESVSEPLTSNGLEMVYCLYRNAAVRDISEL